MFWTMSGPIASELVFAGESSIDKVDGNILGGDNMDNRVNVFSKPNIGILVSGIGFLTPRAKLAFAELR